MWRRRNKSALLAMVMTTALLGASEAHAETDALWSADGTEVSAALRKSAKSGKMRDAKRIARRLGEGLPAQLGIQAIDALVQLGFRKPATAPLRELTLHRHTALRARAMRALGELKVPNSVPTLMDALDDPERNVRNAAAAGLGMLRARNAIEPLFALEQKGRADVLAPLCELVSPRQMSRVLEHLSAHTPQAASGCLTTALTRRDYPAAAKLRLVDELSGQHGPNSHALLVELRRALPDGRLRMHVARTLHALEEDQRQAAPEAPADQ